MPREELKSRLGLATRLFADALSRLVAQGAVAEHGAAIRTAGHEVQLSPAQDLLAAQLLARLSANSLSPPSLPELRAELDRALPGARLDEDLLGALALRGQIVRVSEDLLFTAEAYNRMVDQITGHLRLHGKITVAEVRDLFGTSRRYVLGLLEHLDREHVTRRVGDERVLASRA
jgi:selenocysteine-specific elongation factor